jgi:hypothetical protein
LNIKTAYLAGNFFSFIFWLLQRYPQTVTLDSLGMEEGFATEMVQIHGGFLGGAGEIPDSAICTEISAFEAKYSQTSHIGTYFIDISAFMCGILQYKRTGSERPRQQPAGEARRYQAGGRVLGRSRFVQGKSTPGFLGHLTYLMP